MKLFLSHSLTDAGITNDVYTWLKNQSYIDYVWIDKIELKPGDYLMDKITQGISSSDYLIPLLTKNSITSSWVKREIKLAMEKESQDNIQCIPLLLKGCKVPRYLNGKVYVAIDDDLKGIEQLIRGIQPNSHLLKIQLTTKSLDLNESLFIKDINSFFSDKKSRCCVYLDSTLDKRIIQFVKRGLDANKRIVRDKFEEEYRKLEILKIQMPLFLHNLGYVISQLITDINSVMGGGDYTIRIMCKSVKNLLKHVFFYIILLISEILCWSSKIEGNSAITNLFNKYIEFMNKSDDSYLALLNLVYRPEYRTINDIMKFYFISGRVRYHSAYLFNFRVPPYYSVQAEIPITPEITTDMWYTICIPQMLAWFIYDATFRENTPIREFEKILRIGYNMKDFDHFIRG